MKGRIFMLNPERMRKMRQAFHNFKDEISRTVNEEMKDSGLLKTVTASLKGQVDKEVIRKYLPKDKAEMSILIGMMVVREKNRKFLEDRQVHEIRKMFKRKAYRTADKMMKEAVKEVFENPRLLHLAEVGGPGVEQIKNAILTSLFLEIAESWD